MKTICSIVILLIASTLSACNFSLAGDVTPPPGYQPAQVEQAGVEATSGPLYPLLSPDPSKGQAIFIENCSPCHGTNGQGDGPQAAQLPNPVPAVGAAELARQVTPAEWFRIITQGNMERFMPPFIGLPDDQRWDLVAYLLSLSAPPANIARGAELYQANCVRCHGRQGQGDGPDAAGLALPDFTNQEFMAGKSAIDFFQAITNGSSNMPIFGERLSEMDRWALVDYLRSLSFVSTRAETSIVATPVAEITPGVALTLTLPVSQTQELGVITGTVIDSAGSAVTEGLTVTLHGFDQTQMVISATTSLKADGTYAFPNVTMPSGRMFLTSLQYGGITYASEVGTIESGQKTLNLPIQVFETTTDPSGLVVDRLHFFFELLDTQTLRIVELYVISNPGTKTVVAVEQGGAVVTFSLPSGATNLEFQDGKLGERYIETSSGFGDTAPIRPGQGSYQVLFSYQLAYSRKAELVRPITMKTNAVVILVPEDGLKVKGSNIQDAGSRDVQGTPYRMYNGSSMNVGQELRMTISGSPTGSSGASSSSTTNLVVGLAAFGAVLIVAGLWIFRRYQVAGVEAGEISQAPEAHSGENTETIMDAILALDDLYQEGQLPEEAYRQRRAELKERLKEAMGS
jgi:mono/diheme cytochrome c family protein